MLQPTFFTDFQKSGIILYLLLVVNQCLTWVASKGETRQQLGYFWICKLQTCLNCKLNDWELKVGMRFYWVLDGVMWLKKTNCSPDPCSSLISFTNTKLSSIYMKHTPSREKGKRFVTHKVLVSPYYWCNFQFLKFPW